MLRIPAIAIPRPRTASKQVTAPEDVANAAQETLRRQQNLALAEKRKDGAIARAALDARLIL